MGQTPPSDMSSGHNQADVLLAAAKAILANDRFSDDAQLAGELSEFVALALKTNRDRTMLEDSERKHTESRLVEQAAFVINNPAPVLRVSRDGIVLDANPAASALLGADLTDRPVGDCLPELAHISPEAGYASAPLQIEGVVGDRSFLFTLRPDAATESYYVYGSDITERKGAESRLAEQAAFVINNPAPVLRVDRAGIILDVNPAASALLGADLTGRPVDECLPSLTDLVPASGYLPGPLQIEDVLEDRSYLFTVRYDAPAESYYIYGSDITERKALEKLVIDASDTQRRRIGRDLHDTLGQNLTGLSFLIQGLSRQLAAKLPDQSEIADKIVRQTNESIAQVRFLAKGLTPVGLGEDGLAAALGELAGDTESLFGIPCVFQCDKPVIFNNESVSTQLYHIAQEAVNNATKYAQADRIDINLAAAGQGIRLVVSDDGVGLSGSLVGSGGMGMSIMRYRAGVIGASLRIDSSGPGGVTVTCTLPQISPFDEEDNYE
jgi:signal transduction histidine kinase